MIVLVLNTGFKIGGTFPSDSVSPSFAIELFIKRILYRKEAHNTNPYVYRRAHSVSESKQKADDPVIFVDIDEFMCGSYDLRSFVENFS